jgi:hypothetical protein
VERWISAEDYPKLPFGVSVSGLESKPNRYGLGLANKSKQKRYKRQERKRNIVKQKSLKNKFFRKCVTRDETINFLHSRNDAKKIKSKLKRKSKGVGVHKDLQPV